MSVGCGATGERSDHDNGNRQGTQEQMQAYLVLIFFDRADYIRNTKPKLTCQPSMSCSQPLLTFSDRAGRRGRISAQIS